MVPQMIHNSALGVVCGVDAAKGRYFRDPQYQLKL